MKQKYDGYRIRLKQLLFSMLLFLMISALPLSFLMWSASGNDVFTVLAEEENEGEEEKTLVITVVERTEAEDIEENEIPLAAYSDTEERAGTRHAMLAGLMLAGVIAYTVYFVSYDRKLYDLRLEAAEAEYQAMTEKRE